jgi:hypothetical protein
MNCLHVDLFFLLTQRRQLPDGRNSEIRTGRERERAKKSIPKKRRGSRWTGMRKNTSERSIQKQIDKPWDLMSSLHRHVAPKPLPFFMYQYCIASSLSSLSANGKISQICIRRT